MGNCLSDDGAGPPPDPELIDLRHFDVEKEIGRGAFGKVHACIWKFAPPKKGYEDAEAWFAMKIMEKEMMLQTNAVEASLIEMKLLAELHHPFLCNLHFCFQDSRHIYFVLDLFFGGDLEYFIKNSRGMLLNDTALKFMIAELILALDYVHNRLYCHRDIKPANIVLNAKGHVGLIDFNVATPCADATSGVNGAAGTLRFMSEAQIDGSSYGWACDWWALGCVMFELYTGARLVEDASPPIQDKAKRIKDMRTKIASAAHAPEKSWLHRFKESHVATPEAVEVMNVLLHSKPEDRGELLRLMNLKYFDNMNFEVLPLRAHDMPFLPQMEETNCDGSAALMDAFEEDEAPTCKEYLGEDNKPFVEFEHNTKKTLNRRTNRMSFSGSQKNALYAKRRKSVTPAQRRIMSSNQRAKNQSFCYMPDLEDARSCDSQHSSRENRRDKSYRLHTSARKANATFKSSFSLQSLGEDKTESFGTTVDNRVVPEETLPKEQVREASPALE